VAVGITESDFGKRRTSAGIVENLLDDSTEVAVSFCVIENAELGSTLSETGVRLENTSRFSAQLVWIL